MKKGWPVKRLGEVCEIIMGQSPDGESYNTTGEGVPLINGPVEFSAESFGKTVRTKFTTQPTKFCKEGDLILCVRGSTTGRMNIAGFDACVGRGVAAIRAKQYQPWINHFISSKRDEIHGKGTGATFPNVSGDSLANFELVVPPLAEQQRIVGLLDEAFEGLATAKANAEKNLQNARALFESHLQSVFTQRGAGWVEKKLGEVSEFKNGLNYNKSSGGQTLPVVGVADFQDNYFVPLSELQSATIDGDLADNYAIQPNDILTVRSNGSKHLVGRCMLVGDVDEVVSYSGFIIRIRFDAKVIFPQFLLHFMKCQVTRDILTAGGGGANITNINQEKLSTLLVPLPPYKTQVKLAAALDDKREETQRLARLYERKHAALEALKKSLLHQAFTGLL